MLLLRLLLLQKLCKLLDQLLDELLLRKWSLRELLLRLASSPTTAATLLLLPWLLSLLLLLRASRSRSVTVITKARLWHPGRRTVMLVESVDRFVQSNEVAIGRPLLSGVPVPSRLRRHSRRTSRLGIQTLNVLECQAEELIA